MSIKGHHMGMVLAGCLLAGAAHAQGGSYAMAQIGTADVDGFSDNATVLIGTYGMQLPNVHPNFSIEGEVTFTVDDAEDSSSYTYFGTTYKDSITASYLTIGGYAVYTMPLNQKFDIYGRAGLHYMDVTVEACSSVSGFGSSCVEASDDDIDLTFGVGGNYALSNTLDITAAITFLNDVNHYSVGAKFGF